MILLHVLLSPAMHLDNFYAQNDCVPTWILVIMMNRHSLTLISCFYAKYGDMGKKPKKISEENNWFKLIKSSSSRDTLNAITE